MKMAELLPLKMYSFTSEKKESGFRFFLAVKLVLSIRKSARVCDACPLFSTVR